MAGSLKRGGKVAYAVLSFGGFLGLGAEQYPLPWSILKYDTDLAGYVVNLTKDQLQAAPKYGQSDKRPQATANWAQVPACF